MIHEKITHIDLFSGIGGFALAADRVFGNVEHVFCDIEPFAQEVLKKHWPDAPIYSDIRGLTKDAELVRRLHGESQKQTSVGNKRDTRAGDVPRVHLLTGGFPCQPFSQAGRRRGEEDDRFLWPEMLRVIGEFQPEWVIAENVRGLLTQGGGVVFERVCTDLESLGYEVQPIIIPAVAVGAPHRRDRVWFIGHARDERLQGNEQSRTRRARIGEGQASAHGATSERNHDAQDTIGTGLEGFEQHEAEGQRGQSHREGRHERPDWNQNWLEVAARLCRMDDGLPRRLDRNPRLKALGNAIVPQVAEEIIRAIKYADETH